MLTMRRTNVLTLICEKMPMKHRSTCAVVCLIVFCLAIPAQARIIHVPDESPSIRSGIGAAANGDTVMVSPGVYDEWDLSFNGKRITVMSTDPHNPHVVLTTIINANHPGRGLLFDSDE